MDSERQSRREYAALLRMHERLLLQLQRVRDELESPATKDLIRVIRARTGSAPGGHVQEIFSRVEEAIRALKLSESAIQQEVVDEKDVPEVDGMPNLPAYLARFLAERSRLEGFRYEVRQDAVRGWIVTWKEYTKQGTVRGSGQFYERPYAWLEE